MPNPARGTTLRRALHLPGVHLALPAHRPAGFRPYRHRLHPARLDRREQVAEAVSRQLPQPRRVPRGLHHADRRAAGRRCSTRCGCASAAIGIRAAACRSTCSGRPARRPRAPGSRRRRCAPYRGRGSRPDPQDGAKGLIRDRALALGFDAVGFCRAELGPEARDAAGAISRRRPARRHGLARRARRAAQPSALALAGGAQRHRPRPVLRAGGRSARRPRPARSRRRSRSTRATGTTTTWSRGC